MYESVLIAGSGGQGVLFCGTVLAQSALIAGYEVTFFPSYGAEIRGGTAHCTVVMADFTIGSPIVQRPLNMVILNQQSALRFPATLAKQGRLILNSSLVTREPAVETVTVARIPATRIGHEEFKTVRVANMLALGLLIQVMKVIPLQSAEQAIAAVLIGKQELIQKNHRALQRGFAFQEINVGQEVQPI